MDLSQQRARVHALIDRTENREALSQAEALLNQGAALDRRIEGYRPSGEPVLKGNFSRYDEAVRRVLNGTEGTTQEDMLLRRG